MQAGSSGTRLAPSCSTTAAATSGGFSDFAFVHPIRNRWFLVKKNVPGSIVLRHLPLVVWSELVLWVRAVYRRKVRGNATRLPRGAREPRQARAQRREILGSSRLDRRSLERLLQGRGLRRF